MKNILNNKYKLFTVLAAVTILFASCSNGTQTKNSGMSEGKALVSFKVQIPENIPENGSRAITDVQKIASDPIGWDEIQKIVLKIEKYNAENQLVSYCDDFEWETSVDADTGITTTAYEQMQAADPVELEFGIYAFDVKMYLVDTQTQEEKQCYWACTYESHINSSTETITLNAAPAGTGDLTVNFSLNFSPNASEDCYPSLKAGLYDDAGCTTPIISLEEIDSEGNFNVSVSEGTYYLKYVYYMNIYKEYDYDLQQSVYDEIPLNTVGPIPVYINAKGAQATIEIEEDDFNTLPGQKGTFIFDSTLIDIVSEPITDDFYLNNGTVTFRVKDHDTNAFINSANVSVELYYGAQRVDESYYTFDKTKYNGTEGESDFDPYFEFKLKEDKPLIADGKYQLSIIATKPAAAAVDENGPFFYSARTIDLDVKPLSYFEFDAGGYYSATELSNEMKTRLNNLRSDAIIRVYGTPYSTTSDVEIRNMEGGTDSVDTAQEYFEKIASTLEEMVKYNLVDLDMSELDNVYTMDLPNYDSDDYFYYGITCNCLKSIKLPASLHNIPEYSIWEAANLKTIEFTIGENDYDRYDIAFWPRAFKNVPALEQFIITNKTTEQTNLLTCDNGKLLLSKINDSTASVVGSVSAVEQFTIPSTGDISVTKIDDYAFYGSKATAVTGLNTVKEIGFHAFEKSYITTLTGLSAVEEIQDYAFCDSKITAIPDLSHLTQSLGSGAFNKCTNLQTITIDEAFLDIINSNNVTFDTFDNCVTQNLIIDVDFNLDYSGSAYSMPGTSYGSKLKILDDFKVADTLTFNKEVTLPDIAYSNDLLNDVSTVQFFYNSRGSSSSLGLKHVVFKQKSYIGAAQFGKFVYLESIVFEDELNQCASEIGKQAFWVNPEEYESDSFQTTRSADDIVLTGVIRISFNAINVCTEGGTLNVPSTLIAVNQDAFKGIPTEDDNAVTPVLNFPAGGMWVKASSLNTNYGNTETTIKEWLQSNQSELTITAQDGVAGTDAENPGTPKIEINVDVPGFSQLSANGLGNYDNQVWYYHLLSD